MSKHASVAKKATVKVNLGSSKISKTLVVETRSLIEAFVQSQAKSHGNTSNQLLKAIR